MEQRYYPRLSEPHPERILILSRPGYILDYFLAASFTKPSSAPFRRLRAASQLAFG